jgi:hypothetical protein
MAQIIDDYFSGVTTPVINDKEIKLSYQFPKLTVNKSYLSKTLLSSKHKEQDPIDMLADILEESSEGQCTSPKEQRSDEPQTYSFNVSEISESDSLEQSINRHQITQVDVDDSSSSSPPSPPSLPPSLPPPSLPPPPEIEPKKITQMDQFTETSETTDVYLSELRQLNDKMAHLEQMTMKMTEQMNSVHQCDLL